MAYHVAQRTVPATVTDFLGFLSTALLGIFLETFLGFGTACNTSPELSMPGPICGNEPCKQNGASLTAPLPNVARADVPTLQIEICRNYVCAHPLATPSPSGDGSYVCTVYGPLAADCRITPQEPSPPSQLTIQFTGPASDFANQDYYTIRVAKPGQAALYTYDRHVDYVDDWPNGRGCNPLCRFVTLE